jgi:hypothetical protein
MTNREFVVCYVKMINVGTWFDWSKIMDFEMFEGQM